MIPMGPVRSTDGMVTVAGIRYRREDAEARGLLALVGEAEAEPEEPEAEESPEADGEDEAEAEPEEPEAEDGKKAGAPANKWRRTANKSAK